ncbi:MAG TPA: RNA polymerase sigma factor SigJ [Polyangiaceae bacterium]|nr:RNA polymerase sigma factor SigJ [Polyangiaceae bacterium]
MSDGVFEEERPRLVALAYRLLGSAAEAEDVVQDAYIRYRDLDAAEIRNPSALLTTMVTRMAINVLASARWRRERYEGPWLPEPVVTGMERDPGSISTAFLLLLETLSPRERAVFVLAKVFDYNHAEISEFLGVDVTTSRQLLHRASEHIESRKPRFRYAPAVHARLVQEFLIACSTGDPERLGRVLATDVVARTDHGGKAQAARRLIIGVDRVARFALGLARKTAESAARYHLLPINGGPGLVLLHGGIPVTAITFETDGERICEINIVRNPDKLRPLHALASSMTAS